MRGSSGFEHRAEVLGSSYKTKRCPQCGQELFADMDMCFGCLYTFEETPEPPQGWDEDVVPTDAYGLDGVANHAFASSKYGLRLHTTDVDVTVPLPTDGLVVGRGTTCDVILHGRSVSRQHVRFDVHDGHVTATDLGATNRAMLQRIPVGQDTPIKVGDELTVCHATITLVEYP